MSILQSKITIFSGINDVPVEPTTLAGCNGSHLIAKHNELIDSLIVELNNRDSVISNLLSRITSLESQSAPPAL
jgi:hypothetical protein